MTHMQSLTQPVGARCQDCLHYQDTRLILARQRQTTGEKRARHLTVSHAADQKGLVEYLPACFAAGLAAAILLIDPGSSLAAEVRLPSPYTCWQLCMMYRSMPTTKSVIAGQGCESVAGALWLQCTLRSQVHACTGSEVWQCAPLL